MNKITRVLWLAHIFLLAPLSCGNSSSSAGGGSTGFSVYASKGSIGYSTAEGCSTYGVHVDVLEASSIPAMSATVDGTAMTKVASGFEWQTCTPFVTGQQLHVALTHTSWGSIEFDLLVPDTPSPVTYSPDLDTWLEQIQDADPANDSIAASWVPTTLCNDFWGFVKGTKTSPNTVKGVVQGSTLSYANSGADSTWLATKDDIVTGGGFNILTSIGWRNTIPWNGHPTITAWCDAAQFSDVRLIPAKVAGTYDLTASYTAENEGFSVNSSNETAIVTIVQSGTSLSVNGKTGSSGSISGTAFSLTGDILPGAGSGGSQSFDAQISASTFAGTISGTLSGTVMAQFPSSTQPALSTITSGSFTLAKR